MGKGKRTGRQGKGDDGARGGNTGKAASAQSRLKAAIRNAVVFAVATLYYAYKAQWWMVAVFGSITMGFGTNALARANEENPSAKRAFAAAYYFFFLIAVGLALYGLFTKRF